MQNILHQRTAPPQQVTAQLPNVNSAAVKKPCIRIVTNFECTSESTGKLWKIPTLLPLWPWKIDTRFPLLLWQPINKYKTKLVKIYEITKNLKQGHGSGGKESNTDLRKATI